MSCHFENRQDTDPTSACVINPPTVLTSGQLALANPSNRKQDIFAATKICTTRLPRSTMSFEPKHKVELEPPKDDIISLDYLAKCDGKDIIIGFVLREARRSLNITVARKA